MDKQRLIRAVRASNIKSFLQDDIVAVLEEANNGQLCEEEVVINDEEETVKEDVQQD